MNTKIHIDCGKLYPLFVYGEAQDVQGVDMAKNQIPSSDPLPKEPMLVKVVGFEFDGHYSPLEETRYLILSGWGEATDKHGFALHGKVRAWEVPQEHFSLELRIGSARFNDKASTFNISFKAWEYFTNTTA